MQQYLKYLGWLALVVGALALCGTVMPFAAAGKATIFLVLVAVTTLGAWHVFPAAVPAARAGKVVIGAIIIVLAFGYWDDMAPFADKIGISRNLLRSNSYDHASARLEGAGYTNAQEIGAKCLQDAINAVNQGDPAMDAERIEAIQQKCDAIVRKFTPKPAGKGRRDESWVSRMRDSYSSVEPSSYSHRSAARAQARVLSEPEIQQEEDAVVATARPRQAVAQSDPTIERTLRELDRKAAACTSQQCVADIKNQFDQTRKEYRKTQNENSDFNTWLAFAPDRFGDHFARGELREELATTTAALRACGENCKELATKRATLQAAINTTPSNSGN